MPTSSMITNRMLGGWSAAGGSLDDEELLLLPNLHEDKANAATSMVPAFMSLECISNPSCFLWISSPTAVPAVSPGFSVQTVHPSRACLHRAACHHGR